MKYSIDVLRSDYTQKPTTVVWVHGKGVGVGGDGVGGDCDSSVARPLPSTTVFEARVLLSHLFLLYKLRPQKPENNR